MLAGRPPAETQINRAIERTFFCNEYDRFQLHSHWQALTTGSRDRAASPTVAGAIDRVDGQTPPPDWMSDSPAKTELANEVQLLINLLTLL